MKRDMDLVRKVLFLLESSEAVQPDMQPLLDEGYAERTLSYHCVLIAQAGLAKVFLHEDGGLEGDDFIILSSLTWEGHNFIEAARNDTIWAKAKAKAQGVVGGLMTDALKMALNFYVKKAMAGELGLDFAG